MRILVLAFTLTLLTLFLAPTSPEAIAGQGDSPDEMREANRAAGILLSGKLKRDRPGDYEVFRRIRPPHVLVVRGQYDHIEWVLRDLGVPFTAVSPESISRHHLRHVRAILVNCPGRIGEAHVRWLREFVSRGGSLFTTDWAVLHIIEKAFPRTIRYTRKPTKDDVVSIRVLEPVHHFLHHVLTGRDHHCWWLESESYPFTILDRRKVQVLIESEEMRRKYGAKPVAVTFRHGKGRVVHIISHSYLQRTELRTDRDKLPTAGFADDLGFDEESEPMRRIAKAGLARVPAGKLRSAYSAQQFLANFLIDAMKNATEPPEPEPRPEPPRPDPPVVRPAGNLIALAQETRLHDAPGGTPVKLLAAGLRLYVHQRRDGWARVSTPANEFGWVRTSALRR